MKLIFASHNKNKLKEIRNLIPGNIKISSLEDINHNYEIEENGTSIEENAAIKSRFVYENLGYNAFADDSGLEVDYLNGEPGVFSARYAGEQKNDEDNIDKLLLHLKNITNRKAQFKTVISLCIDGEFKNFTGIIRGTISHERKGKNGFGYDPVFIPENQNKTFAEMTLEQKSKLSHRALAVNQLIHFLKNKSQIDSFG